MPDMNESPKPENRERPPVPFRKQKTILLRVSKNLYEGIDKAISLGIADNASEFVRRCVVNQLLDLKLLGLEDNEKRGD